MEKIKAELLIYAQEFGFIAKTQIVDDLTYYFWTWELQKWLREKHLIYIIPKPVIGEKNGYDSFPILGWNYDALHNTPGSRNSYYLGFEVMQWYTAVLQDDEMLEDLNLPPYMDYEDALVYNLHWVIKNQLKQLQKTK